MQIAFSSRAIHNKLRVFHKSVIFCRDGHCVIVTVPNKGLFVETPLLCLICYYFTKKPVLSRRSPSEIRIVKYTRRWHRLNNCLEQLWVKRAFRFNERNIRENSRRRRCETGQYNTTKLTQSKPDMTNRTHASIHGTWKSCGITKCWTAAWLIQRY